MKYPVTCFVVLVNKVKVDLYIHATLCTASTEIITVYKILKIINVYSLHSLQRIERIFYKSDT